MTLNLKLNPDLNAADFTAAYAAHKCVQIPHIFADETAHQIQDIMSNHIMWRLVIADENGKPFMITRQEAQKNGAEWVNQHLAFASSLATKNIGYAYNTYPMIEAYFDPAEADHPLHEVTQFLNSSEFIEFGSTIIGATNITKVDAQATFYARGHYLTRHVDQGHNNERRAAYTLGFTQNWQTDWGGLLMFLDENQDISRALMPRFNMLTLFDGMRIHSVSPVSAFAGSPRFSIAGWLRDDPVTDQWIS